MRLWGRVWLAVDCEEPWRWHFGALVLREAEVLLKGFKLERHDGAVPLWVASESGLEEDGLERGTAETL